MMKWILLKTLLVIFCCPIIGQECLDIIIKYESLSRRINTHVGHEYYYTAKVADVPIKLKEKVKLTLCSDEFFEISCDAGDYDPVYDDNSNETQIFYFSDFKEGVFSFEREVVVMENAGRYAGETSSFLFRFEMYVTK